MNENYNPLDKELNRLVQVIARLRAEDGCPWDREQTHGSLKAACVEEAAEVVGGINILEQTGNAENLKEELGDLLLQVVMHAQIAKEEGLFTLEDVMRGITDKMIRRHPHVFGATAVSGSDEVLVNWAKRVSVIIVLFCFSRAILCCSHAPASKHHRLCSFSCAYAENDRG